MRFFNHSVIAMRLNSLLLFILPLLALYSAKMIVVWLALFLVLYTMQHPPKNCMSLAWKKFTKTRVFSGLFVMYLAWVLVSVFWAVEPRYVYKTFFSVLGMWTLTLYLTSHPHRLSASALIVGVFFTLAISFVDLLSDGGLFHYWHQLSANSTVRFANWKEHLNQGVVLLAFISIPITYAIAIRFHVLLAIALASILVMFFAYLESQTAFVVYCIAMIMLALHVVLPKGLMIVGLMLAILGAGIGSVALFQQKDAIDLCDTFPRGSRAAIEPRLEIWDNVVDSNSRVLTGYGARQTRFKTEEFGLKNIWIQCRNGGKFKHYVDSITHAHNASIQHFYELGYIGLAMYLLLFLALLSYSYHQPVLHMRLLSTVISTAFVSQQTAFDAYQTWFMVSIALCYILSHHLLYSLETKQHND